MNLEHEKKVINGSLADILHNRLLKKDFLALVLDKARYVKVEDLKFLDE